MEPLKASRDEPEEDQTNQGQLHQQHHHQAEGPDDLALAEEPKEQPEGAGVSCATSMNDRMPNPIVWASPGGIAPLEPINSPIIMHDCFGEQKGAETGVEPGDEPRDEPGEESIHHQQGHGDHQNHQRDPAGHHDQEEDHMGLHHHQGDPGDPDEQEAGEVSCAISMKERMPSSIVWAARGGIAPKERECASRLITTNFHESAKEDADAREMPRESKEDWIRGAGEEDNERYKKFLAYCEEWREERRARIDEENGRKRSARRKELAWEMLRESIRLIKENEGAWGSRKSKECERIKEEERMDRLAIVAEKKKKYGIKKLSKDETQKIKQRTGERMEIARAKGNYWKQYRDSSKRTKGKEEEEAWERLRDSIVVLEENGNWIEKEDDVRRKSSIDLQESIRNIREEEGVIIKEHTNTYSTVKEGQGEEDSCQEKEGSRRSRICLGVKKPVVNQEEEEVKGQLKFNQEDRLLSKKEENPRKTKKRLLGGGEGREEWMQMDILEREGTMVGEFNSKFNVKHGQTASTVKLQGSGTFINTKSKNTTIGVQKLVERFEYLAGGRGKEEDYALNCIRTPKKVFEFEGSSVCSPSKKIRLAKPKHCKVGTSLPTSSKASKSRSLDPWRTTGGRSIVAGSTASPGHRLHAREEQISSVFQGEGTTSACKGSRSSVGTGTKARWPPLTISSACRSGGSTNIIGEQPDKPISSQTEPSGTTSTEHARRTCCPTSRTTSPSGLSVLTSHLQTSQTSYSLSATSCSNKIVKKNNISTTPPQPEPAASSSPPVPLSSTCYQEDLPKKKENVRRQKTDRKQEDILPDQAQYSHLPGQAQGIHPELPGVSQESETLETSAIFSPSTIQSVDKGGGDSVVEGKGVFSGIISNTKVTNCSLPATQPALNCRNDIGAHSPQVLSKTTGTACFEFSDKSRLKTSMKGTLRDYCHRKSGPRGPNHPTDVPKVQNQKYHSI